MTVDPEDIDVREIKGTIGVTFCGRSGSVLLSNLFDSHPEILSCPPHSLHDAPLKIGNVFSEVKEGSSGHIDIDRLVELFPFFFPDTDHERHLGGSSKLMKFGVSREEYKKTFKRICLKAVREYRALQVSDCFAAMHLAYAAVLGRKLTTTRPLIVWQQHNPIADASWDFVSKHLVNLALITTIRSPLKAIDSALVHYFEKGTPAMPPEAALAYIVTQFFVAARRKNLGCPEYAVKFEDMHSRTESLMRALAKVCGIEFTPILLRTTLDGGDFLFPKKGKLISGVNRDLRDEEEYKVLTSADIELLRPYLTGFLQKYGYREPNPEPNAQRVSSVLGQVLQSIDVGGWTAQGHRVGRLDELPDLILPEES